MIKKNKFNLSETKQNIILNVRIMTTKFFSKNKLLVGIYYLFTNHFDREHKSVIKGRLKHLEELKNNEANLYLLRRNIHRIEKGLLMKSRKDIFGTSFINETVTAYQSFIEQPLNDNHPQKKWAYDVLKSYFDLVSFHPTIEKSKNTFNKIQKNYSLQNKPYIPYRRTEAKPFDISIEDLKSLSEYRRSVRWFNNEKISKTIIDESIAVGTQAPTACNRQPYKIKVFQDKEILKNLVHMPMGTGGFADSIPNLMIVIGDLSAYPFERDRHLIYIDSSLAVMSTIYALEVQGVSSCILNWPDMKKGETAIREYLNLKDEERAIMFIAFGYPDFEQKVAYSQKKPLDEVRDYNII